MSLHDLLSTIRTANRRSASLIALRGVFADYPREAGAYLNGILTDPEVTTRAKSIILYHLEQFGLLPEIFAAHEKEMRTMIDSVERAIERDEEDGIDPFSDSGSSHA
ncbi:MAG: hypothetical protein SH850_19210 [Planctomycetaceae bacterium]|nr:hypothetical protein [Planctomycetaceae bacterium]